MGSGCSWGSLGFSLLAPEVSKLVLLRQAKPSKNHTAPRTPAGSHARSLLAEDLTALEETSVQGTFSKLERISLDYRTTELAQPLKILPTSTTRESVKRQ